MSDCDKIKEKLKEIIAYWENEDGVMDEDVKTFLEDLADYIRSKETFKLYKYCPPDYYSIRNFEIGQVHFSPNGALNDIYEGVPAYNDEISYEQLCGLSSLALTSCFSERYDSVLMWSHYADSSKGFCIEYDFKRLTREEIISLGLYPVLYEEKRLIWRDVNSLSRDLSILENRIKEENEYDGEELLENLIPLMLYKGNDWKYEKEWRMVYTKKDMYNKYKKETSGICIPLKCISGVILGYRMEESMKNHIRDIVKKKRSMEKDIVLYEVKLSSDKFDFNVKPILVN